MLKIIIDINVYFEKWWGLKYMIGEMIYYQIIVIKMNYWNDGFDVDVMNIK